MHLYHTMGWTRELWIESLGMPAVLPPPEEEKKVVTATSPTCLPWPTVRDDIREIRRSWNRVSEA